MKTLKVDHELADQIQAGTKRSTWRVKDDKELSVNDDVRLIDKVDQARPETWRVFGVAHIERVIEKRLGDLTDDDMEGHNPYASQEEMLTIFRGYYGNDVSLSTPIKILHFTFNPLEQGEVVSLTTDDIKAVKVFTDGGSRGNPGPSASGFVVLDPNTNMVLVDKGVYIGVTTNNQAEYLALKYALEEAQKMGVRKVEAYMDSMLVVNQIKGTFKVRNRDLFPIHDAIMKLINSFEYFTVNHVPREFNKLADAAVNRALDAALDPKQDIAPSETPTS